MIQSDIGRLPCRLVALVFVGGRTDDPKALGLHFFYRRFSLPSADQSASEINNP